MNRCHRAIRPGVMLALVLAFASAAQAATYYVNAGHDRAANANAGTQAAPWKTIQHAASKARPGDVVIVEPGEYDEAITFKTSGTEDQPVTFRAEPARKVV